MAQDMPPIGLQVELDVISMAFSVPGTRHGVACIILNVALNRDEPWAENRGKFTADAFQVPSMTECNYPQEKLGLGTLASTLLPIALPGILIHTRISSNLSHLVSILLIFQKSRESCDHLKWPVWH